MKAYLASLIILAVLLSCLASYLFNENAKLQRELQDLKSKYSELEKQHAMLNKKYDELSMKYGKLSENYSKLQEEHLLLKADYEKLSALHNELVKEHELYVTAYENIRKTILSRTSLNPESWPDWPPISSVPPIYSGLHLSSWGQSGWPEIPPFQPGLFSQYLIQLLYLGLPETCI